MSLVAALALATAIFLAGLWAGLAAGRRRAAAVISAQSMSARGPQWGNVMAEVHLDRPTFREAVESLLHLSNAKVRIDWDSLQEAQIQTNIPLSLELRLRDVTLDQVLPDVVDALQMANPDSGEAIRIDSFNGLIHISTGNKLEEVRAAAEVKYIRAYDVDSLIRHLRELKALYGSLEVYTDGSSFATSSVPVRETATEDYLIIRILDDLAFHIPNFPASGLVDPNIVGSTLIVLGTDAEHERIHQVLKVLHEAQ